LNPQAFYCAMRWDYSATSRAFLRRASVRVTNPQNGKSIAVRPADWGPNAHTNRLIDLSPGALAALDAATDDIVHVEAPAL
jgi:rare lipoprotein A (peptidoglycan hydrolase)